MAQTTTNFKDWFEHFRNWYDEPFEIEALHLAVRNEEDHMVVKCESLLTSGMYIVTCSFPEMPRLLIASEKARKTFLSMIETELCEGYDVESWVGFEMAIANDNS